MSSIREAKQNDVGRVKSICSLLDFDDISSSLDGVYLLEDESGALGLLKISRYDNVHYLSEVGIVPYRRGEGLGLKFVGDVLKNINSDVYIYTVIPDFFKHLGFEVTDPSTLIPTREEIDCEGCKISKCRCMVRKANDS